MPAQNETEEMNVFVVTFMCRSMKRWKRRLYLQFGSRRQLHKIADIRVEQKEQ